MISELEHRQLELRMQGVRLRLLGDDAAVKRYLDLMLEGHQRASSFPTRERWAFTFEHVINGMEEYFGEINGHKLMVGAEEYDEIMAVQSLMEEPSSLG